MFSRNGYAEPVFTRKRFVVTNFVAQVVFTLTAIACGAAHASYPVYADGDLAPLGTPDGLINTADYLVGFAHDVYGVSGSLVREVGGGAGSDAARL